MFGATERIIGAKRQVPGAGRSEATKQRNRRAIVVRPAEQAAEVSEEAVSCATGLRRGGGRHVFMASDHQTALRRSGHAVEGWPLCFACSIRSRWRVMRSPSTATWLGEAVAFVIFLAPIFLGLAPPDQRYF